MKLKKLNQALLVAMMATGTANANIIISEVHPTGSSTTTYVSDWFELTNTGVDAVSTSGWQVDDASNGTVKLALRGISSIAPGQSVVFIETDALAATDAAKDTAFKAAWFGTNIPSNFLLGYYGGSGIGLSSAGDAVNIFDSTNALITRVDFGSTVASVGITLDNAAGIGSTNVAVTATISTLSAVGVNGAFTSVTGNEIGSPGLISPSAVPVPAAVWMFLTGLMGFLGLNRKRKAA